jgi:diguanylate cyclase (GGDEF)-like protein/PAS domain S-box-containing protein
MFHMVRPFVDHPGARPPGAGTLPTLAAALTALGTYRARVSEDGLVREFVEAGRLRSEGVDPRSYAAAVEPADQVELARLARDVGEHGRGEVHYRVHGAQGLLYVRERAAADRDGTVVGVIEDVGREHDRLVRAETIERLLIELEEHLYTGWFDEEGTYHETYQSPNGHTLLGGVEADENAENWMAAVHPDDREAYEAFMTAQMSGDNASIEFRLCGADGVTRWLRERSKSQELPGGAIEVIGIATDISSGRAAAAALAASEAKLEHVLKAVDAYVYVLERDEDGVWHTVSASPNRERFTGGTADEGDSSRGEWLSLIHPDDKDDVARQTEAYASGAQFEASYRLVGYDGVERWVLDRNVRYDSGDSRNVRLGLVLDVSDRRQLERRLQSSVDQLRSANSELRQLRMQAEQQARTDVVTGAHNRLALSEHVALALEGGQEGGLVLFDLDHFKQINDALGHGAGDRVLVEVARRLRSAVRPNDCVARWGGEEFAVLLREVGDEHELASRAVELQRVIDNAPIVVDGEYLTVEVSGGATPLTPGASLDTLVEQADRALYAAKRRGRNRVLLASDITEGDLIAERPEAIRIAEALAVAVGVREGAPAEHPAYVASLAARIARALHLDSRTALRCELGGWLHDIGKLSVPERVLLKPTALDEEEWEIMRRHPELGERIVERIPALHAAGLAIRHHHEQFDGTGYPDGLSGFAIPVEARIVAVADTFSAMTQLRPYAPPRTAEEALQELRRCAGTQFDMAVVAALESVLAAEGADALPRAA